MRPLHAACRDELCITLEEGIWIDAGARYVCKINTLHIYYVKQNIMSIYSKNITWTIQSSENYALWKYIFIYVVSFKYGKYQKNGIEYIIYVIFSLIYYVWSIPRTQLTCIFGSWPSILRVKSSNIWVIWVLGTYIHINIDRPLDVWKTIIHLGHVASGNPKIAIMYT